MVKNIKMNKFKKIIVIIFLIFMVFLIVDYQFQKPKNNLPNDFYLAIKNQKEKNNFIPKKNQNRLTIWFLIILGIIFVIISIIFVIVRIIIYFIFFDQYQGFSCGLQLKNNKIEVIFCRHWDANLFFDQLWKLDVETKQEQHEIYQELNKKENKEKIKNFFLDFVHLLKFIDSSFLKYILYFGNDNNYRLNGMAQKLKKIKRNHFILYSVGVFEYQQIMQLSENDFLLMKELKSKNAIEFFSRITSYPCKISNNSGDVFLEYFYGLRKTISSFIIHELDNLFCNNLFFRIKYKNSKLKKILVTILEKGFYGTK